MFLMMFVNNVSVYIREIGLSKRYLWEETYNKILNQINKDLPEDQKVKKYNSYHIKYFGQYFAII